MRLRQLSPKVVVSVVFVAALFVNILDKAQRGMGAGQGEVSLSAGPTRE